MMMMMTMEMGTMILTMLINEDEDHLGNTQSSERQSPELQLGQFALHKARISRTTKIRRKLSTLLVSIYSLGSQGNCIKVITSDDGMLLDPQQLIKLYVGDQNEQGFVGSWVRYSIGEPDQTDLKSNDTSDSSGPGETSEKVSLLKLVDL